MKRDLIRRINARLNATRPVVPIRPFQRVQFSNLHDNSCGGRVCFNPAHMPNEGVKAIDVTVKKPTSLIGD